MMLMAIMTIATSHTLFIACSKNKMTREERQKELNNEIFNSNENTIGLVGFDYLRATWCNICEYYHGNNKCSCDAFPNGIPDKFSLVKWGESPQKHTKIEKGQKGTYVFKSLK